MMNALARLVSILVHPLLMPTYLLGLLSLTLPPMLYPISPDSRNGFLLLIFIMTFALPVLNVSFFRLFGSIRSFAMESRRERILPFSFIAILYGVVTYLLYSRTRVGIDDNLFKLLIIIDGLVLLSAVVTFFYKISVHAVAVCGVLGILLPLTKVAEDGALLMPTLAVLVVAGLVMSARLQLNAHTPREVLVGALAGFSLSFAGMIILF
jgi:membrane-associated phospholipid phosphatase